jgi:serine/threonine-protein kinase ULK4
LNEYGNLKLSDFGNSKKLVDLIPSEENPMPSRGHAGTPYYMAPELFTEEGILSFQSDLWSFGCILYELAFGKPPFFCSSLNDLIKQITEDPTPNLPNFSSEFNSLISGLLEKDPVMRISWKQLKAHPFWNGAEFTDRQMPR